MSINTLHLDKFCHLWLIIRPRVGNNHLVIFLTQSNHHHMWVADHHHHRQESTPTPSLTVTIFNTLFAFTTIPLDETLTASIGRNPSRLHRIKP